MKLFLFLAVALNAAPIMQEPPRHKVYVAVLNRFVYDKDKMTLLDYQRASRARFERTSDSTFTLTLTTPGKFDFTLTTNKGPLVLHCEGLLLPDPGVVGQDKIKEMTGSVRRITAP